VDTPPTVGRRTPDPEGRPLRADARLNQDRLLRAARKAFARDGAEASLKAVAREAGVGTLYRRFPTRDHLIEAAYRGEIAELCATAPRLLGRMTPAWALGAWADRFLDVMTTRRAMADVLPGLLSVTDGPCLLSHHLLVEAMTTLLTAGVEDGVIRADADPVDVLMGLSGIGLVSARTGRRDLGRRLATLLLDGLRTGHGR
jgi:AcrR family transcriptional regulator